MSASPGLSQANPSATVFSFFSDDEPIRGEQFGQEHLEAFARQLAEASRQVAVRRGHPLLEMFRDNRRTLIQVHRIISEAHRHGEKFGSDADWLLDNYHIITDSLAEVQVDLPQGYYNLLPKIAHGPMAGLPRVYSLAFELVAHCDSALDEARIDGFVQAFQSVSPLTIGELWAVPIMFRLVLLDNLRRLARQIVCGLMHRTEARTWVERHFPVEHAAATPMHVPPELQPDAQDGYVLQLFELLRGQDSEAGSGVGWLEDCLAARGTTSAEVARRGHQQQAANQISIGNCVTSLRLLSALDWTEFFESVNIVESILRRDPAGVYPRQNFATRDRYRREVEKLSRGSDATEIEVANRAVRLAGAGPAATSPVAQLKSPRNHVGYYLIGAGRIDLEAQLSYHPPFRDRIPKAVLARARLVYFGGITVAMILILLALLLLASPSAGNHSVALVIALVIAATPASEGAVEILNGLVVWMVPPRVLPRLRFRQGIPADCATFVVIPTLLTRTQSTAALLERLEIHFLSNSDPNLFFALLTDFTDSANEHEPGDADNLNFALAGIRALNQRHAANEPDRFFLFHRHRRWNPSEGCWMGWERKRGKLVEFNRLLRGAGDTSYSTVSGDISRLPRVRFVITLDSDTQLPRESALRLIGTLAHPLNEPVLSPPQNRVIDGYGVLQPRISISFASSSRTRFARAVAGSSGLDPYVTAVSDVYQDLFGIGSFTGKGIYEVDAFQATAGQMLPENRILSHDLIEGNFARCGLVSDIELLDEFPTTYLAYARREHRWVRGDWQILPWLFARLPTVGGNRRPNPLALVERWKIFDNVRRSLVAPTSLALLIWAWFFLPRSAWLWTLFVAFVLGWPLVVQIVQQLGRCALGIGRTPRPKLNPPELARTSIHFLLRIIFLVDQARLMVDAIARTLYRMMWSKRRLLEWETASATESRLGSGLGACWRLLWLSPALAIVVGAGLSWIHPFAMIPAIPFLIGWLLAPSVAYWMAQPRRPAALPLSDEQRQYLRRLARMTWHFFESFVTSHDRWLPPDNYQEDPKGEVAHRTSPTNIGMYLLSCLSAHDFGYLSLPGLLKRLNDTFDTLDRLERSRGHFYNWYDTTTLHPLFPAYISTVDSGNLLGCLVTIKQGLIEKECTVIPSEAAAPAFRDTLALAADAMRELQQSEATESEAIATIDQRLQRLATLTAEAPTTVLGAKEWLERLQFETNETRNLIRVVAGPVGDELFPPLMWIDRLAAEILDRIAELDAAAPWLSIVDAAPSSLTDDSRSTAAWTALRAALDVPIIPRDFQAHSEIVASRINDVRKIAGDHQGQAWLARLDEVVTHSASSEWMTDCRSVAMRADRFGREMEFKFLYNHRRHLFAIGFNMSHGRLDNANYDLLASEASLTSFLAVARSDVPTKHWFRLGRAGAVVDRRFVLLSWGGTMFEYLMPRLMMRDFPDTLLDESRRSAVACQIDYGRQCRVPWGISESAFAAVDGNLNYQYQSFGVPGLGLKRGLASDLVVAPYATFLAAMLTPSRAIENLHSLQAQGAIGAFGFYEAIDYSRKQQQSDDGGLLVKCFMAHHQGMSFLALVNCLLDNPMPRRFHSEPMVRATEMLLQERVPEQLALVQAETEVPTEKPAAYESPQVVSRRISTPFTAHPRTHLLSNGDYTVMVTNAGGSRSTWRTLDVTRWREDRTTDSWGQFCYIRDCRSDLVWSAGLQPTGREADEFEAVYAIDKAEFRRSDDLIETYLEITVSPESPAEIRRLIITNHDLRKREIELTSYAELVLGPHVADLAHPAFGKLFLETEFVANEWALLCRRRPRSATENSVWAVHVLAVDGPIVGEVRYETDRAKFLGRGRTPRNPAAMDSGNDLSMSTGPVLDPIFSIRCRCVVEPDSSIHVAFTTAMAETREQAISIADQYHDYHGVQRAFDLAWAHCQVELRHLRLTAQEAHLFQRLGAHIVFAGPGSRAAPQILQANHMSQRELWRLGVSGDFPIVLVRIQEPEQLRLARELLAAHEYLRLKGLPFDLIVLNEHESSYFEDLQHQIQALARATSDRGLLDKPGGVFLRKGSHLSQEDRNLLQSTARCVFVASRGALAGQIDRIERSSPAAPRPPRRAELHRRLHRFEPSTSPLRPRGELSYSNGIGGFSSDGREYVIELNPDNSGVLNTPPSPWINVIANPQFGFIVSECGLGCTWAVNSQLNRLTPWNNDPVCDLPAEVIYIRDEATGEVWSPTPLPLRGAGPYRIRHGQGYSVFEHNSRQIEQELRVLAAIDEPIKLLSLKLRNLGRQPRRLSATYFAEWVLGTVRDQTAMHVTTEIDLETGVLLARNPFNADFGSMLAFVDVNRRPREFTADRTEFVGRNGGLDRPAGMLQTNLSGTCGTALDPCAALRTFVDLTPGQQIEIVFFIGQTDRLEDVRRLSAKYRSAGAFDSARRQVDNQWNQILNAVQVKTPNAALDLLVNRWLLYQVLSCRYWGRTALYQSGGAFGFRDQLQDVMALIHCAPNETRAHLLRAASHQFPEGDVQHWWHPPTDAGVRTRCSDDFLWLPYVAAYYLDATGDSQILEEKVTWLEAPHLRDDQEDDYRIPAHSSERTSLYDHCLKAIEHGCRFGSHGLPLIGAGDWNDGMNRVGSEGKGESVWNGWFLYTILRRFSTIAAGRGESDRAQEFLARADRLRIALEEHAWDGRWYRRAFWDDGTPLGSAENQECRIDSIAQSWAVISCAADADRARQAWTSLEQFLIRDDDKLILLFTPPFDRGDREPGYIKGYVPGIRENGGQYTHAAAWCVYAAVGLGMGSRAVELFDLLNPIHHAASPEAIARYRVEPYVVAADVYSNPSHLGRGGWTWYTGSASWMYRAAVESILGLQRAGSFLLLNPCIPKHWDGFEITYRHLATIYHIQVQNPQRVERGVRNVILDGKSQPQQRIELIDDGNRHEVIVELGSQ